MNTPHLASPNVKAVVAHFLPILSYLSVLEGNHDPFFLSLSLLA